MSPKPLVWAPSKNLQLLIPLSYFKEVLMGMVDKAAHVDEILTQAPNEPASSREEDEASPEARGLCLGLEHPHRYGPKIHVSYRKSSILRYSHTAFQ